MCSLLCAWRIRAEEIVGRLAAIAGCRQVGWDVVFGCCGRLVSGFIVKLSGGGSRRSMLSGGEGRGMFARAV